MTIPGESTFIACLGGVCIVLGALAYGQHARLQVEMAQRSNAAAEVVGLQTQLELERKYRAEEQRRTEAQKDIANDAQRQLEHAATNRDAAATAAGRLLDRLEAAGRSAETASRSAAATGSAPASSPDLVPADLYRLAIAGGRRVSDRAVQLADEADKRRIAGLACERSYDALTPP